MTRAQLHMLPACVDMAQVSGRTAHIRFRDGATVSIPTDRSVIIAMGNGESVIKAGFLLEQDIVLRIH